MEKNPDSFLATVMKPAENVADDPGPDPRKDCPVCGGFGTVRTFIKNGRRVVLERFKTMGPEDKGFACSACYPDP